MRDGSMPTERAAFFIYMTAVADRRNPRSVEERNEPVGEQTCFTWVDEEEASAIPN
jgi:hypothetical protein